MTWKRASELTRQFPKNKYGFSIHLVRPGDYVETYPLTEDEALKIKYAAFAWAWNHKYTIKYEKLRAPHNKWTVRIYLIKRTRCRLE